MLGKHDEKLPTIPQLRVGRLYLAGSWHAYSSLDSEMSSN